MHVNHSLLLDKRDMAMAQATFYTVTGPRGVYHAVRNHETGKIWTERTEHAAHQQAADEGLSLVDEQSITHMQLLDLMIPQAAPPAVSSATMAGPDEAARPAMRVEKGLARFLRRFRRTDNAAGAGSATK